jgi:hypothetical protein
MDTVRVSKEELLEKLRTNRDQHVKDFKEAVIEYRKAALKELTEMVKQAKSKGTKITRAIVAPEPVSYESSYTTAIRMLEMSVDEEIELDQEDFAKYVEDNWQWRGAFAANTLSYKNSR